MGIYQRDNINYSSMLDNVIKNRIEKGKELGKLYQDQGKIWGDTARDIGQMVMRATEYEQAQKERADLQKKYDDLVARRDAIRNAYTQSQDYQPYTSTPEYKAIEYMKDYNPDYDVNLINTNIGDKYKTGSTYIVDDAKTKWLQAHPGMTEDDYEQFVAYQNALYGGR